MSTFVDLLAILIAPMQRLESVMVAWKEMTLDNATGPYIESRFGGKVGLRRSASPLFTPVGDPTADDVFRRAVRAQIATNRATGRREELLNVTRLIVHDDAATIVRQKMAVATVLIRIDGVAVAPATETLLALFLTRAAANGVRLIAESNPSPPAGAFTLAGGIGLGLGDATAPGSGGTLSDRRG